MRLPIAAVAIFLLLAVASEGFAGYQGTEIPVTISHPGIPYQDPNCIVTVPVVGCITLFCKEGQQDIFIGCLNCVATCPHEIEKKIIVKREGNLLP